MEEESKIYDGKSACSVAQSGFCNFKLLKVTAYAMLYRASKAGKYFLVKTTKDNSERQLAMLRREYELSIGCDHPNIVHIYTYEEYLSVGAGIIMEYIEGRTLAEYLAESPTNADRNRVFEELLLAVGYLHKRGIIHNDLKPENILISRVDNTLKLIDFGLADNDAQFAMCRLGCTPQYASPELRAQSQVIDARSDIYSIGVLLENIFQEKYHRIAQRCKNANPDKRYENASTLQRAWTRRHRPLKVVLSIVASVIFILPLCLFGQTKFAEYNKTRECKQLLAKVENDVEHIYTITADSISRAVYYEFANNNIVSFWEALVKYQQENIATIADPELNTLATNVYTHAINRCNNNLQELAKALPVMERDGMSADEIMFYDMLLARRRSYQPYSAE